MPNFYTDIIQKDARFCSTATIADLSLLEPVTRQAVEAIMADAKAAGIKLMVFETYRSQERQRKLFYQGVTQLKAVGVHHYGLACDLVKNIGGQPSWDGDFSCLGPLARKHGLIWGGDWGSPEKPHSFRDPVHVQRCSLADQGRLFRGEWYPDQDYNPYGGAQAGTPTVYRLTSPMMRGEPVFKIQCRLNHLGYLAGDQTDWVYGPKTAAAVADFQRDHGLTADGIAGPLTAAKMGITL